MGVKGYLQKAGITQKQLCYQQSTSTRMVTPKEGTLELSAELARCSAVHHVDSSAVRLLRVSLLPPLPATVFLPIYCWSKALKNTPSYYMPSPTGHETLCLPAVCLLRLLSCPFLPWANVSIGKECHNWEDMPYNNPPTHSRCDCLHKTCTESS